MPLSAVDAGPQAEGSVICCICAGHERKKPCQPEHNSQFSHCHSMFYFIHLFMKIRDFSKHIQLLPFSALPEASSVSWSPPKMIYDSIGRAMERKRHDEMIFVMSSVHSPGGCFQVGHVLRASAPPSSETPKALEMLEDVCGSVNLLNYNARRYGFSS